MPCALVHLVLVNLDQAIIEEVLVHERQLLLAEEFPRPEDRSGAVVVGLRLFTTHFAWTGIQDHEVFGVVVCGEDLMETRFHKQLQPPVIKSPALEKLVSAPQARRTVEVCDPCLCRNVGLHRHRCGSTAW